MSSSSMYFDSHQPSLGGFSVLSPQDEAVHSKMKKMLNMQQAKLNHLSSKLGQSNGNSELQTTQDNQPSSGLSQLEVSFPARQQFPEQLYHMLELAEAQVFGLSSSAVSWLPSGRAFTVRDEKVFMEAIVPLFFKQTKLRSFGRQLNLWGFKRLNTDAYTYCHEHFVRGSPEGLKFMVRATYANRKKQTDLSPKVSEGQLQHHADDCTQVSNGSLSGVQVSSQSPILRKGLKSRRVSMEDDTSPSVSSVGCLPSHSVADSILKRQVTFEDDVVTFDMMGQVGISALNEGVPGDEFAEYIDHMMHLL